MTTKRQRSPLRVILCRAPFCPGWVKETLDCGHQIKRRKGGPNSIQRRCVECGEADEWARIRRAAEDRRRDELNEYHAAAHPPNGPKD
jgi:hypothetical protein